MIHCFREDSDIMSYFCVVISSVLPEGTFYEFPNALKQLAEELRGKEKRERVVQEELEGLKDSLRAEQKATSELTEERERLRKMLEEKESALLVCFLQTFYAP